MNVGHAITVTMEAPPVARPTCRTVVREAAMALLGQSVLSVATILFGPAEPPPGQELGFKVYTLVVFLNFMLGIALVFLLVALSTSALKERIDAMTAKRFTFPTLAFAVTTFAFGNTLCLLR